jgi:small-conductance mechanosensitive channel
MNMDLVSSLHPWVLTVLWAVAALVVVEIVFGLITRAVRRLTRSHETGQALLSHAEKPVHLLALMLAIQAVWQAAPESLYAIEVVRHVTTVAIIGAMTWIAMQAVAAGSQLVALRFPIDREENLHARTILTQTRVLTRVLMSIVVIFGIASALMTFPSVRQIGAGLLASAGLAGLVVGFAAKPVLGNLLAGLQIALTQPIRLDDVVIVEGEWGRIEEITGSYVVIRIWDERCLVVPLQWFIEHPFQNWTRTTSHIIGTVYLWVDYWLPLEPLRAELKIICESTALWDKRVSLLQVTDANDRAMQLRALISSVDAGRNWDLRCLVRERLIAFIQREYPENLPRLRNVLAEITADRVADAKFGADRSGIGRVT